MATELLDVFDDLGRHQGVLDRATVHARGLWHQVAHILVVARRSDGPAAILQRRAAHKVTFPGLVDLSATGHLNAGEDPRHGVRELREELGIDVDPGQMVSLGVRRLVDSTPEGVNREFAHVFVVFDDRPLDVFHPDPDEVSGVIEVRLQSLRAALDARGRPAPAVECGVDGSTRQIHLGPDDLVPEPPTGDLVDTHPHAYWVSVLTLAELAASGHGPLAI
jgi:isopentenyldiphosphate isomerase